MNIKTRYKRKAIDSFKTKLNIYLFYKAIWQELDNLTLEDFRNFKITEILVDEYSAKYWQLEETSLVHWSSGKSLEIKAIYDQIKIAETDNADLFAGLKKDYIDYSFPILFKFSEFERMLEGKSCKYCGITKYKILDLADAGKLYKKSFRGWSLEIDRRNSNFEYFPDNCVMSCYWCNNAKTDEFTADEFMSIGKAIGKVWDIRMRKHDH